MIERLALDGLFWRRLARWGASQGPEWWVRHSPRFIGAIAAGVSPSARRAVAANLRRARGDVGPIAETRDVLRTFATFAGCFAEVMSNGSKNAREPEAEVCGLAHVRAVVGGARGAVFATAHTAGWEVVGPLLGRELGVELVMVMERERDGAARNIQDSARRAPAGIHIEHVGDDATSALPLLRHLREGRVVALQMDRTPPQMRTRRVRLFGAEGAIPEGPIRLAQLASVPILPVFSARLGFRRYLVDARPPIEIARRANDAEIDLVAQRIADAMSSFIRAHPADWLDFSAQ